MYDAIIVGAGAAGLMAAVSAINNGYKVVVIEKMPYAGKKILITGKGRCNITNYCDREEFIKNIHINGRFFNSAFSKFSNTDLIEWLNTQGVSTKVERGMRVFPESDKAIDVRDALVKYIIKSGSDIIYNSSVKNILCYEKTVQGVTLFSGKKFLAKNVIVATGGKSYATTGSDGYGYRLAEACGHTIAPVYQGLVPLECKFPCQEELQGLSLKNVSAILKVDGKKVSTEFGEMLFAHFGLTGPIILSLSTGASKMLLEKRLVEISLDLKPALNEQMLEARIQRELQDNSRKHMSVVLRKMMPASLVNTVLYMSNVQGDKQASQISKVERQRILNIMKSMTFTITGVRPFAEAIITAGGVNTKEINPKNMQSKIVSGLYFAGELLDVSGYTGGFNLQIAFSTGYVAGMLK